MTRTLGFLLSLTTASILLAGCSTTYTANPDPNPYCTTSESTTLQNGDVKDSMVRLECSDDHLVRAEKFYGVDKRTCRFWEKTMIINGTTKQTSGVLCKDENGNFRPLSQY
jgi:hypothetical protein